MATCADEFEEWLCTKLKALNTDQDVFSTYIRGILEGDEPNDDKLEALEGILLEIETDNMGTLSQEILDKWDLLSQVQIANVPLKLDFDAQLASIMEKQAQSVVIERKVTDEERKYREAILAQYSHVSDNEDDDNDEANPNKEVPIAAAGSATTFTAPAAAAAAASTAATPGPASVNGYHSLSKNTNAEDVFKAEKEKRDKAKADSEKKKAADKANKEKQKQQQQERKEKEKKRTQKGERKR